MGFEDYSVMLHPNSIGSTLNVESEEDAIALHYLINEQYKGMKLSILGSEVFSVYRSSKVCFEILLPSPRNLSFTVSFAYCNPPEVFEEYCCAVSWLMEKFDLYCIPMRDFPLSTRRRMILQPELVFSTLQPSVIYNRRMWQEDVGSNEEIALLPAEAIEYFILKDGLYTSGT